MSRDTATAPTPEQIRRLAFTRCRLCLGMGYRGRTDRGRWKIRTCPRCGGGGEDPRPETLPENKATELSPE